MINCEPQIWNFESVDEDSFDSDCEEDSDNEIEIVDNDSMIFKQETHLLDYEGSKQSHDSHSSSFISFFCHFMNFFQLCYSVSDHAVTLLLVFFKLGYLKSYLLLRMIL